MNDMLIVQPKTTLILSNMFYGQEMFDDGQNYVAYRCNNTPHDDGCIYILTHYDSARPVDSVGSHFKVHEDNFVIIAENADHDDVIEHGIEDVADYDD